MNTAVFVDDNKLDNLLTTSIIEMDKLPIKPITFEKASEALSYLDECELNDTFPIAIFIDWNMPSINGIEFTKIYVEKYYEKHPETTIYYLTSIIHDRITNFCDEYDAVGGCFEKPFSSEISSKVFGQTSGLNP